MSVKFLKEKTALYKFWRKSLLDSTSSADNTFWEQLFLTFSMWKLKTNKQNPVFLISVLQSVQLSNFQHAIEIINKNAKKNLPFCMEEVCSVFIFWRDNVFLCVLELVFYCCCLEVLGFFCLLVSFSLSHIPILIILNNKQINILHQLHFG